jgi:hypothetical protein
MSRTGKPLIIVFIVLIILLFVAYKFHFSLTGVKVMSVHDRVTNVVQAWARMPALPDDKQELEVIWGTSGPHFEFFPYGAQDLTTKLQSEFRDSAKTVLQFTDIYASTNTGGKIKTVDQLATAVRQNYSPK